MQQGNIHLCIKPVQRARGQSLVARVAYATASSLFDPRTKQWHNYRWKKSEVGGTILITRQQETSDYKKFAAFWGEIEKHHKRKDAVPGRTMSVALPCELSVAEQKQLMLQYGRWLCATYGVGVQISAHKLRSRNPHFHVALTACEVFEDGTFGKKVTALDPICAQRDKEALAPAEILRATWADMVNAAYAKAGVVETVDHRSYLRRGIDKIPQRHEGIWQHLPCPMDCPVEYNIKIKIINEVLHGNGTSIYGVAGGSIGIEKNASDGMERDQGRTDQPFHAHQCLEHGGAQSYERSPDAHGDTGRSAGWVGSTYPDGNAESQNRSGYIDENQQGHGRHANEYSGVAGTDFASSEGLMHIVALPLVQAVESLRVQALAMKQQVLRMTAATLPEVTVQHVSLCDMAGNALASATDSLELNTLHMRKNILQLRVGLTPVVTIEKQSLLDIVTPSLATAIYSLEKYVNRFGKQIEFLHENVAREAAKAVPSVQQPPTSPTPLQTKKEPLWDEALWQRIVHIAKQQPDGTEKAKAVFVACATIHQQYPQLTLAHFAYILEKQSVRTKEEQNKILLALRTYVEPQSHIRKDTPSAPQVPAPPRPDSVPPVQPSVVVAATVPAAEATHPVEACPPVEVITLGPKRPDTPKANAVPQEGAHPAQNMPSRTPSLSSLEKQQRRKIFEEIVRQQNLPHATIDEKKHQVLRAAIAFWREYPHLHFDHVEPLLRRYTEFDGADWEYLRQRLLQNRPEHTEEAMHESAQKACSSTAESHVEDSAEAGMGR